jgi:uncharacterized membrane protein
VDKFDFNDPLPPVYVAPEADSEERMLEEGKIPAMLAYVPFLCFYALFLKRDNPYAYHHGRQGLILFIAELIAIALRWDLLWNLILIFCGAVAIWGITTAFRGQQFRLPILSDLLDRYRP